MIRVLFIGGVANGEILEFPEFTLLSDLFPLYSADGRMTQVYELGFDSYGDPQYTYRLVSQGFVDVEPYAHG